MLLSFSVANFFSCRLGAAVTSSRKPSLTSPSLWGPNCCPVPLCWEGRDQVILFSYMSGPGTREGANTYLYEADPFSPAPRPPVCLGEKHVFTVQQELEASVSNFRSRPLNPAGSPKADTPRVRTLPGGRGHGRCLLMIHLGVSKAAAAEAEGPWHL